MPSWTQHFRPYNPPSMSTTSDSGNARRKNLLAQEKTKSGDVPKLTGACVIPVSSGENPESGLHAAIRSEPSCTSLSADELHARINR